MSQKLSHSALRAVAFGLLAVSWGAQAQVAATVNPQEWGHFERLQSVAPEPCDGPEVPSDDIDDNSPEEGVRITVAKVDINPKQKMYKKGTAIVLDLTLKAPFPANDDGTAEVILGGTVYSVRIRRNPKVEYGNDTNLLRLQYVFDDRMVDEIPVNPKRAQADLEGQTFAFVANRNC